MGPGHFGIALALKPAVPKAPLLGLLIASEALDILCFGFAAAGIEKFAEMQIDFANGVQVLAPGSVPWSHGLFMAIVWSLLVAGIAYLVCKDQRVSAVFGFVVFSHWVLDFIVHFPDLPLFFEGSPLMGLGLWESGPGLIAATVLEILLLAAGIIVYVIGRRRLSGQPKLDGVVSDVV